MKKILTNKILAFILIALFYTFNQVKAQNTPPLLINYQAVAHDNSGNTLSNQSVDLVINILNSSNSIVWSEEHNGITTNDYGLISLMIGNGTNLSGPLSGVAWSGDTYFLEIFIASLIILTEKK